MSLIPQNNPFTCDILIIGGGAAGCFAAISAATHAPNARIILIEKSNNLLSKVRISGGGRCNVTNQKEGIPEFASSYPRGERRMLRLLYEFSRDDTIEWFQQHNVELKTEADGRMFPTTNSSETIVNCLLNEMSLKNIFISMGEFTTSIKLLDEGFTIETNRQHIKTKSLIIAIGGQPKREGFSFIENLGINIITPVPSLFTFNVPQHPLKNLMGLSTQVRIRIEGCKLEETGPILITHWGFSGPAVLKLSAKGARLFHELDYTFTIRIHWIPELSQDEVRDWLKKKKVSEAKKRVFQKQFDAIPQRLWEYFCSKAGISTSTNWSDLSSEALNKLIENLTSDAYSIAGKTTFKEEFVTCGGVALNEIHPISGMSKKIEGLFFAGEVLDVDGITGGFNFQHAWSGGYLSGKFAAQFIQT
jgi:predicted Rossmann fold flavoprotein